MTSIFTILATEPQVTIDRLYWPAWGRQGEEAAQKTSWASQAVFQSLSPLAQCLVMRILLVESSVSGKDLSSILCNTKPGAARDAVNDLVALRILLEDSAAAPSLAMEVQVVEDGGIDESKQYRVNPAFQLGMKRAMVQPEEPCLGSHGRAKAPSAREDLTLEQLERYSDECWNKVLALLVNLSSGQAIPTAVANYVIRSGLMALDCGRYTITAKGYEFLLKDYVHQLWDYILDCLMHTTNREECYSLLFLLSYCKHGRAYEMDSLSKLQRQLAFEFSQVGILYIKGKLFYPCYIASALLFPQQIVRDATGLQRNRSLSSESRLQIIVETNLQVVAYVANELHLAMLRLFVDVHIRLPNMAMGRITREKSREAFRAQITAAQIIDFLTLHAHPVVTGGKKAGPVIPENVSDQLVLWEQEMKRIHTTPAVVADFRDMASMTKPLFATLVRNMESAKLLLWCHAERMMLACKPEAHASIEQFLMKNVYHS